MPTNYNPLGWAKKFSTAHNLMQIGDEVVSRHGVAKIIGIELCENKYEKYGTRNTKHIWQYYEQKMKFMKYIKIICVSCCVSFFLLLFCCYFFFYVREGTFESFIYVEFFRYSCIKYPKSWIETTWMSNFDFWEFWVC